MRAGLITICSVWAVSLYLVRFTSDVMVGVGCWRPRSSVPFGCEVELSELELIELGLSESGQQQGYAGDSVTAGKQEGHGRQKNLKQIVNVGCPSAGRSR